MKMHKLKLLKDNVVQVAGFIWGLREYVEYLKKEEDYKSPNTEYGFSH